MSFVVLVFYTGELPFFTRRIRELGLPNVTVSTVDSVQGGEADFVFLSLCRSNAHSRIGFLRNPNRVNVAVSQAKFGLVIFGDIMTFARCTFWKEIFNELNNRRLIFSPTVTGIMQKDMKYEIENSLCTHLAIQGFPFQMWEEEVVSYVENIIGPNTVVDAKHIRCHVEGREGARSGRFVVRCESEELAKMAQQVLNGREYEGTTKLTLSAFCTENKNMMCGFLKEPEIHPTKIILRGLHRAEAPHVHVARARQLLAELIIEFSKKHEVHAALAMDRTFYYSSLDSGVEKYIEVIPHPPNQPYPLPPVAPPSTF